MKADEQTTEEWGLDRRVGFAVGLLMLILMSVFNIIYQNSLTTQGVS